MSILTKFPMVSQLTSKTSDGKPSENAPFDCVPASIGAAILWYQGKTQWDDTINPDRLKDAAYGEAYTGGTAAAAYINVCKSLGYNLYPINGNPTELVQKAHELIDTGIPVVFTEPDPYVNPALGWSHVCVWYASGPGNLTALDPYIAAPIQRTDAQWANLVQFNQIWVVETTGGLHMLQLTDPMGKYFTDAGGSVWHCPSKNVNLGYGHLAFFRQHEGIFGLPLINEVHLSVLPDPVNTIMIYECAIAMYDPAHKFDNRPGSGDVYLVHIDGGIGQQIIAKPLLAALQTQIDSMKQQITDLQSQRDQLKQSVDTLNQEIDQLKQQPTQAEIDVLSTRLASYQNAMHQVSVLSQQSF